MNFIYGNKISELCIRLNESFFIESTFVRRVSGLLLHDLQLRKLFVCRQVHINEVLVFKKCEIQLKKNIVPFQG